MPKLIFYQQQKKLFEYRLQSGRIWVGRSDGCDLSLNGKGISRRHCSLSKRSTGWFVKDHSRFGTTVNGETIQNVRLQPEDKIGVGDYTAVFTDSKFEDVATTELIAAEPYSFVIASDSDLHVHYAKLVVSIGPDSARVFPLHKSVVSVGSTGSSIVLSDPKLRPNHCILRVSRGRVMIEPSEGPIYFDGQKVHDITPLYADEEFRIGDTFLRVESYSAQEQVKATSFGELVGSGSAMQKVFGLLRKFAAHDFPVLITGDSGTGKELAARGLHSSSMRASGPFIVLNCGALSENLIESELFGYVRGAFTGADRTKDGAFQSAEGGTLFLDELGELPLTSQVKLLRALDSGEVRRVGSSKVEYPNVRILAATNRDLSAMVQQGTFRADLLYRLSVLAVKMPSLVDRAGDIPILANYLLQMLSPDARLTPDAKAKLQSHHWPGNVRELRNVLTRAYVQGANRIDSEHISFFFSSVSQPSTYPELGQSEREFLLGKLQQFNGNKSAVARHLNIARSTLIYKLKRFAIEK